MNVCDSREDPEAASDKCATVSLRLARITLTVRFVCLAHVTRTAPQPSQKTSPDQIAVILHSILQ